MPQHVNITLETATIALAKVAEVAAEFRRLAGTDCDRWLKVTHAERADAYEAAAADLRRAISAPTGN